MIRIDGRIWMYYEASQRGNADSRLGVAHSDDGVTFKRHEDNPIWEKNVFNPEGTAIAPEAIEEETPPEEVKPVENIPLSSLNYKLIGTVTGIPAYSFAIIKAPDEKEQSLYRIGEMIGPAKIVRIERNRIIVAHTGREEMLEVQFDETSALEGRVTSSPAGIKKVSANRFVLDKKAHKEKEVIS